MDADSSGKDGVKVRSFSTFPSAFHLDSYLLLFTSRAHFLSFITYKALLHPSMIPSIGTSTLHKIHAPIEESVTAKTGFWIERKKKLGVGKGKKGAIHWLLKQSRSLSNLVMVMGNGHFAEFGLTAILYFRAIYHPDRMKKRYFSSTGATLKEGRLLLKRLFPLFFRIIFHFSVSSLQLLSLSIWRHILVTSKHLKMLL